MPTGDSARSFLAGEVEREEGQEGGEEGRRILEFALFMAGAKDMHTGVGLTCIDLPPAVETQCVFYTLALLLFAGTAC